MKLATLVLQDGTILEGRAFGAETDAVFELVFNTSMTGYQEILTDPSYRGQAVLFTASHIGNVGINLEDDESAHPQVSAAVIRSLSPAVSNWRAALPLSDWLAQHGVPGISGVDTRWLTRTLRDGGTQKAALSTKGTSADRLLEMAREWPGLDGRDMVKEVTCAEAYHWSGDEGNKWVDNHQRQTADDALTTVQRPLSIVAYDFGIKENILRHLASYGANVTVVPADMTAQEALALKPDGIFLSNGPGDPAGLPYAVDAVRGLLDSGVPVFGICLGHQLIGRALGADTHRLKFGHHGGNHPVQHLPGGEVLITAQNHNYCVTPGDLDPDEVEITYKSLNDDSLEGMRLKNRPVLSVQFHPEAAPGPHDAHDIFAEFFKLMSAHQYSRKLMRIAVFSDIHGNCLALETVLADIKTAGADFLVCLGDTIQGGPQPAETVALLRDLASPTVMGNSDDWLLTGISAHSVTPLQCQIRDWTLSKLSETDREFIAQFPRTIELETSKNKRFLCFHGAPRDYNQNILPSTSDAELQELLGPDLSFVFAGGHVHSQLLRRIGDTFYFRPGSVGYAYDRNRINAGFRVDPWAEYAILNTTETQFSLEFRQVPLDVEKLSQIWRATQRPDAEKEIDLYH